jgi:uncharacterized protein (TIGR03435 family)
MRALLFCSLLSVVSLAAFAQAPAPKLEFEVASVKTAEPIVAGATQVDIGMHIDGAQVRFSSLALRDLLRLAYKVKSYQVEGPDWMISERYDISAKLPDGAKRDQVPDMLQSLLKDRFQITSHLTKKDFPVLGLVVAKTGLKAKQSPANPDDDAANANATNINASGSAAGVSVSFGKGSYYTFSDNKFDIKHLTMAQVADTLARYEQDPVIDKTDAPGYYDFVLPLSQEDYQGMLIRAAISAGVQLPAQVQKLVELSNGDSLGAALGSVGLKLERMKAPLDVIVVDKANKTPTSN